jgi:hypothetical protein
MELRCSVGLLRLLYRGTEATHSSRSHGRDVPPSLLPHHAGWIDIVDVWAQSPLAVSEVLHGLGGKRAKAPSMTRTILGVGSKHLLRFYPTIQIAWCRATYLALMIFSELG